MRDVIKEAVAEAPEISTLELAEFFNAFVNGIMERGKAQPGEKTIIDSLYPAVQTLQQAVSDGLMLDKAVALAFSAAQEGLENATGMKAQHGRAAYYQEKSIGIQDPGATVGVLILKGFVEVVSK